MTLFRSYPYVFFVEEGVAEGGLNEKLEIICRRCSPHTLFRSFAVPNAFLPHASRRELTESCGLDGKSLAASILEEIEATRFKQVVEQVKKDKWNTQIL
jgi:1-deoxy-D-xylulose-5-phosphate synthase